MQVPQSQLARQKLTTSPPGPGYCGAPGPGITRQPAFPLPGARSTAAACVHACTSLLTIPCNFPTRERRTPFWGGTRWNVASAGSTPAAKSASPAVFETPYRFPTMGARTLLRGHTLERREAGVDARREESVGGRV